MLTLHNKTSIDLLFGGTELFAGKAIEISPEEAGKATIQQNYFGVKLNVTKNIEDFIPGSELVIFPFVQFDPNIKALQIRLWDIYYSIIISISGCKPPPYFVDVNWETQLRTRDEKTKKYIEKLVEQYIALNTIEAHQGHHDDTLIHNGHNTEYEQTNFLHKRQACIRKFWNKSQFREIQLEKPVTIGICTSGGGMRAYVSALGFLNKLKEEGVLDITTYGASLSGSAWLFSSLNDSLFNDTTTIQDHIGALESKNPHILEVGNVFGFLLHTSILNGMSMTLGNVFCHLLAAYLTVKLTMAGKIGSARGILSEIQRALKSGDHFLPLATAIENRDGQYCWFEFSPFHVGSLDDNKHIHPDSFGRKFQSQEPGWRNVQVALGVMLAIWGSAFCAEFEEIWDMAPSIKDYIPEQLRDCMGSLYHIIHNFCHCIANVYSKATRRKEGSAIKMKEAGHLLGNMWHIVVNSANRHHPVPWAEFPSFINADGVMKLSDAGIDFNLPVLPLLSKQRAVDI